MDNKRAAEVLLKNKDVRVLRAHSVEVEEATDLGAQALKAWAWVERTKSQITAMPYGYVVERIVACHWVRFGTGPTPLAAVLDAMEKEGKK